MSTERTQLPLAELAKAYASGATSRTLATKYGVSPGTVMRCLRDAWEQFPGCDLDDRGLEWRPVVGYEGLYDVSETGLVRAVGTGSGRRRGHLRKTAFCGGMRTDGEYSYEWTTVSRNGRVENKYVHRMVAEAFIGPCPDGHEVNHLDGDTRNNRRMNLEYVTHKQNIAHAMSTGLMHVHGADNGVSKVSEDEVRALRALYTCGWTHKQLAQAFHINVKYVWAIVSRKTWAHLPGQFVRRGPPKGTRHGRAKLSDADVREIRKLSSNGWTQRRLGAKFNVNKSTVRGILSGRSWKSVS